MDGAGVGPVPEPQKETKDTTTPHNRRIDSLLGTKSQEEATALFCFFFGSWLSRSLDLLSLVLSCLCAYAKKWGPCVIFCFIRVTRPQLVLCTSFLLCRSTLSSLSLPVILLYTPLSSLRGRHPPFAHIG